MDYEIIFYHSGKTAENEFAIEKALRLLPMRLSRAIAATSPKELAVELSQTLLRVKAVFIIGGLDGSRQSTETVLSKIMSGKNDEPVSHKIQLCDIKEIGYILSCADQMIIILPDNPLLIEKMINSVVSIQLEKMYDLPQKNEEPEPDISHISDKLDVQLAAAIRTHIDVPTATVLAEEIRERPRGAKLAISILLLLSCLELLAALILYIIYFL